MWPASSEAPNPIRVPTSEVVVTSTVVEKDLSPADSVPSKYLTGYDVVINGPEGGASPWHPMAWINAARRNGHGWITGHAARTMTGRPNGPGPGAKAASMRNYGSLEDAHLLRRRKPEPGPDPRLS